MIQTLTLERWWPTSCNILMRLHPHARNRRLKEDAQVIACTAFQQGVIRATGKRRVSILIRYVHEGNCLDSDAPLKSLLDGLVACGLLLDDNRTCLEIGGISHERARQKGIVITLEDIE